MIALVYDPYTESTFELTLHNIFVDLYVVVFTEPYKKQRTSEMSNQGHERRET